MSKWKDDPIILSARNLTKHFGGKRGLFSTEPLVRAVDDVSLDIQRGETFAIVGESGCGKSTLARLLLRLIEPTSGTVTFNGTDITKASPEALRSLRRDMQIVFQDPFSSLNPRMTVAQLVAEPLVTHGLAKGSDVAQDVRRLLALVGLLPDHAERYPHEFSGGQRQRIGIARALASRPMLVLGDEPVSALDVSIRAQIINLLEDLKGELGLTMMLVSHDLGVVRHTADRVAVMYLGEIVERAKVESLFETPAHPYTRALMQAIPAQDPTARRETPLLEGDPPSPIAPPSGCRFHTRCPYSVALCRSTPPTLRALGPGHEVACHRASEIAARDVLAIVPASAVRQRRVELFAEASRRMPT
ncbi:AppF ABC-type oligopeptide transport system, ATPase component [Rhabdaerophilaceae bacterium]